MSFCCRFFVIPLGVFSLLVLVVLFFLIDTATTEIYTLSLHDALPIYRVGLRKAHLYFDGSSNNSGVTLNIRGDRKSTRLNSSHTVISYAVFCLKKKTPPRPPTRSSVHSSRTASPTRYPPTH